MYLIRIIVRCAWTLAIGWCFFAIGTFLFVLQDVLLPNSSSGYRTLNFMYKVGSLGVFKGVRFNVQFEQDEFEVKVSKTRRA